jgi:hypothetical protein
MVSRGQGHDLPFAILLLLIGKQHDAVKGWGRLLLSFFASLLK